MSRFLPFAQARAKARSLKLKNQFEWNIYCKLETMPSDIPYRPDRTYRNLGWVSYRDWLGYEEYLWTLPKYKELSRRLEQSGLISIERVAAD